MLDMFYSIVQMLIFALIAHQSINARDPFILGFILFVIPFIMIHWVLDTDSCVFTKLESKLRGVPLCDSFLYRILTGIYKVNHLSFAPLLYIVAMVLWGVVLGKFIRHPMVQSTFRKVTNTNWMAVKKT